MPYRKRERAIAYILKLFESIANTYGHEIIPAYMGDEIHVPVIGRSILRSTLKRYASYVIDYCREHGVEECPVRKEYVPDKIRGKVLKLIILPEKCRELSSKLVEKIELRKQMRRNYEREIRLLRKKLEEYREKAEKLEEVIKIGIDKQHEKEAEYRALIEEYRNTLIKIINMINNPDEMFECIEDPKTTNPACAIVLKIIDVATTIDKVRNQAPTDVFIDLYEKNYIYKKLIDNIDLVKVLKKIERQAKKKLKKHTQSVVSHL